MRISQDINELIDLCAVDKTFRQYRNAAKIPHAFAAGKSDFMGNGGIAFHAQHLGGLRGRYKKNRRGCPLWRLNNTSPFRRWQRFSYDECFPSDRAFARPGDIILVIHFRQQLQTC